MSKLLNHLAPYRESNISSMRGRNDRAPRSDSSPESVQSHDTVSTVVPQPQTSVIAWKANSGPDLDEDETSMLLEGSVVRSEDGGITGRSSEGGDQEADISEFDSEMDPGNESTEQMRLSPGGPSDPGTGGVQSSLREVRPRRIVRHRRQPGWMRSGEWDVGYSRIVFTTWWRAPRLLNYLLMYLCPDGSAHLWKRVFFNLLMAVFCCTTLSV